MDSRKYAAALLFLALSGGGAVGAQQVQSAQEQIVYVNGAKYRIHSVAKGETLYSLSRLYGVSIDDLTAANPALKEGLKAGALLKIPLGAMSDSGDDKAVKAEKRKRGKFLTHTVAKGETLYSVSRRYGVAVETIIADNGGLEPAHVAVGQVLNIRKGKPAKVEKAEPTRVQNSTATDGQSAATDGTMAGDDYGYHVVHAGESATSIAERFGTSEEELLALNGMRRAAEMKTGLIVKVPRAKTAEPQKETTQQPQAQERTKTLVFKTLREGETAKVALLLPLDANGAPAQNYVDFYRGFLSGMDAVRMQGISAEVGVFDTAHDYARVDEMVKRGDLEGADLIVGPVYEDLMAPVVEFAERNAVPVVSPLANIAETNSGVLFQMSPDMERKYDKVRDLLDGSRQVILIKSGATDDEFEREIVQALGTTPYRTHEYVYEHPSVIERRERERERTGAEYVPAPSDLSPLLHGTDERVFVVLSESETDVDRVLAALASANIALTARSRTVAPFVVLGNNRWNRYKNIDRSIYFTDNVVMLSTYHVQRNDDRIKSFDSRYAASFGSIPSLYAYRGYDAAVIFVKALYGAIAEGLKDERSVPLQTPYLFDREGNTAVRVNREWVRVNYHSNFTTTTE